MLMILKMIYGLQLKIALFKAYVYAILIKELTIQQTVITVILDNIAKLL
ncbi:hypothetical protein OTUT144_1329 [Orientia tsutsugamushi str. UT144]|uniref:Uncharacterized protein n=1 Tax=Orientia tsutsugamushi str. UT144 TaxID=1441384 RepID=A0A0F3RK50_ORITS|nr:hypothetical protein OTUT144_1816 [Orientia tsutsugamushi str. UT144]KJW06633.1 hypothetical protein OTUT144_1329 [Orientia tsutsugamushi str. UT144]